MQVHTIYVASILLYCFQITAKRQRENVLLNSFEQSISIQSMFILLNKIAMSTNKNTAILNNGSTQNRISNLNFDKRYKFINCTLFTRWAKDIYFGHVEQIYFY